MKMPRSINEPYLTNDYSVSKFLLPLFHFDILTNKQIASLTGLSPNTTKKYLTAMKKEKYMVNLISTHSDYWHILPKGVERLSEIHYGFAGKRFQSHETMVRSTQSVRSSLSHDVICSNLVMQAIDRGQVYEWMGPTLTKRIYRDYNPDAIVGLFDEDGNKGRMHIELDNSGQDTNLVVAKAVKARKIIREVRRMNVNDEVIAIITTKGLIRAENLVNACRRNFEKSGLPIKVIATSLQSVQDNDLLHAQWFTSWGDGPIDSIGEHLRDTNTDIPLAIGGAVWNEYLHNSPWDTLVVPNKILK
jgi:hypothetical protein